MTTIQRYKASMNEESVMWFEKDRRVERKRARPPWYKNTKRNASHARAPKRPVVTTNVGTSPTPNRKSEFQKMDALITSGLCKSHSFTNLLGPLPRIRLSLHVFCVISSVEPHDGRTSAKERPIRSTTNPLIVLPARIKIIDTTSTIKRAGEERPRSNPAEGSSVFLNKSFAVRECVRRIIEKIPSIIQLKKKLARASTRRDAIKKT